MAPVSAIAASRCWPTYFEGQGNLALLALNFNHGFKHSELHRIARDQFFGGLGEGLPPRRIKPAMQQHIDLGRGPQTPHPVPGQCCWNDLGVVENENVTAPKLAGKIPHCQILKRSANHKQLGALSWTCRPQGNLAGGQFKIKIGNTHECQVFVVLASQSTLKRAAMSARSGLSKILAANPDAERHAPPSSMSRRYSSKPKLPSGLTKISTHRISVSSLMDRTTLLRCANIVQPALSALGVSRHTHGGDLVRLVHRFAALDAIDNIHALSHFSPNRVLFVEKASIAEADEELAVGRIRVR